MSEPQRDRFDGPAARDVAGVPEGADARSVDERTAAHAAIDRLADELLPALVAKLGATGLGEIEVREGGWRVRLRRPGDGTSFARRTSERPSRAQPGHTGHGHAPGALEGHLPARTAAVAGAHSGNGNMPALSAVGPGPAAGGPPPRAGGDPHRAVATSPAVGIYQPRPDIRPGSRVRNGDRIGIVDMLGVPHDVVSPADGILGGGLVEPGQAVEFGQELAVIELVGATPGAPADEGGGRT